ncbi:MAG: hypothetical protein JO328_21015 [Hyphomicrobiales bacterium]|nr:hypothetical protein [Hyphomicrobiales bacterium]MBV8826711.1 hypothetical protein [Hyphomicrobiales bacterium]MBV9427860.1 hypothetical protein [Bradyrhizobiaceae bacterium]
MFSKTIAAVALTAFLATTVAAVAQEWVSGYGYGPYFYSYGFGYYGGRHDPRNTNGF